MSCSLIALSGCRAFGEHVVTTMPLYEDTWDCVESSLLSLGYTPPTGERADRRSVKFYRGSTYVRVEEEYQADGRGSLVFKVAEGYWEAAATEVATGQPSPSTPPGEMESAIDMVVDECGVVPPPAP